mgnify:CR=1 FL=1
MKIRRLDMKFVIEIQDANRSNLKNLFSFGEYHIAQTIEKLRANI